MYDLRWHYITDHLDWFIDGLLLGLKMAVIALAVGSVIGLVCAFIRASGNRWASAPVTIYVEIIRNIPLLLIVFLLYFGLPQAFAPRSAAHEWTLRLLPDAERTFIVALAIYAIGTAHAIMVSVMALTPVHMQDHGATLRIIGITISLHIAGMFALSPVMGWLSDKLGSRPTILIGQALLIAAAVISGTAGHSEPQIMLGLSLLWPASFGMGDIKLGLLLVLGLAGLAAEALLLGLVLAAVFGALLIMWQGRSAIRRSLPLAPFLSGGAVLAVVL